MGHTPTASKIQMGDDDACAPSDSGDDEKRMSAVREDDCLGVRRSTPALRLPAHPALGEPAAHHAGYVAMFASRGLPEPTLPISAPLLVVTGEAPPLLVAMVERFLTQER